MNFFKTVLLIMNLHFFLFQYASMAITYTYTITEIKKMGPCLVAIGLKTTKLAVESQNFMTFQVLSLLHYHIMKVSLENLRFLCRN